jgi:hypothetical protein
MDNYDHVDSSCNIIFVITCDGCMSLSSQFPGLHLVLDSFHFSTKAYMRSSLSTLNYILLLTQCSAIRRRRTVAMQCYAVLSCPVLDPSGFELG